MNLIFLGNWMATVLPSILILNSILLKIYFQDFVVFPMCLLSICVIFAFVAVVDFTASFF